MKNIKGISLCLVISIIAFFLGNKISVVGGPVFGMVIGILIGLYFKDKGDFTYGINFTSKKILQYAVILLGFGLNLKVVFKVGTTSLPVIISTISTALIVAFIVSRIINIERNISILVGVGSSICGGSAIAATAPVISANDDDIAQSISVVFLFNLVAAIIFPTIGELLKFTNEGFALFAGTAINDTSSVTAAASIWDSVHNTNGLVLESAAIVKLTRTLAIIPITVILSIITNKNKNKSIDIKNIFPKFIIYFLLLSLLTTIIETLLDSNIISNEFSGSIHYFFKEMKNLSKFFIIMAMSAIGLNVNLKKLIKSGKNSIILGMICWISIIIVSITVQKVIGVF